MSFLLTVPGKLLAPEKAGPFLGPGPTLQPKPLSPPHPEPPNLPRTCTHGLGSGGAAKGGVSSGLTYTQKAVRTPGRKQVQT